MITYPLITKIRFFCLCLFLLPLITRGQTTTEETPWKCFVFSDRGDALTKIKVDYPQNGTPQLEFNNMLKPSALHWSWKTDLNSQFESLGFYHQREITSETWTDMSQSKFFACKIFFYQARPGFNDPLKNPAMPFCIIFLGNLYSEYDQFFASSPDHPFTLNVKITDRGEGLIEHVYRFGFSEKTVYPIDCVTNGRRMKTVIEKF